MPPLPGKPGITIIVCALYGFPIGKDWFCGIIGTICIVAGSGCYIYTTCSSIRNGVSKSMNRISYYYLLIYISYLVFVNSFGKQNLFCSVIRNPKRG